MNKDSLLFKIIIPLIFVVSMISIVLPSVFMNIPEENIDKISETVSDYNDTQKYSPERTVYEENGKINVYMAVEDNSLSIIEVIDLHSYVSGVDTEEIKSNTDEDKIFIATVNFVNQNYSLNFVLISIIIVFGLISISLSILKTSKLSSVLNFISVFIYFAAALIFKVIQNNMVYSTLNDNKCFTASVTSYTVIPLAGAVLALIITMVKMCLALNQKTNNIKVANVKYAPSETVVINEEPKVKMEIEKAKGFLYGLNGEYTGLKIELKSNEAIIIGRDPKISQLIIKSEKVSRKHCLVRFNSKLRKFIVIDYSFNGTYTLDGERLLKNHQNILPANSVIVIGKNQFQFILK